MNLSGQDLEAFLQELRNLLGQIKVTKGRISETFSLSYVCVVDKEEDKKEVEQVANILTQQASQFAIDLEIVAATEEEVKTAREELIQAQLKKQGSFEV